MMALLTLLPLGMLQLDAAIEHGYWFARSAEFMQTADHRPAGVDARAGRHDLQRRALARLVRVAAWIAPKRAAEKLPEGVETT